MRYLSEAIHTEQECTRGSMFEIDNEWFGKEAWMRSEALIFHALVLFAKCALGVLFRLLVTSVTQTVSTQVRGAEQTTRASSAAFHCGLHRALIVNICHVSVTPRRLYNNTIQLAPFRILVLGNTIEA